MQKLFNKILVPVDFSRATKNVVDKAAGIALEYNCSIELLHVVVISAYSAVAMAEGHLAMLHNLTHNKQKIETDLNRLCQHVKNSTDNKVQINYTILQGTWDEMIIESVHQKNIDLVLAGQNKTLFQKNKMVLNPNRIALKANIAVITVPVNRRLTKLLNIVIPITDFLPVRKLMYGVYMASNYDTTVKLLGIENGSGKEKMMYYLEKAASLIKENSSVKVEVTTIKNDNVAEALNLFSKNRAADLLIVNPQTQTKMPGLFASLFGKFIQKYSTPPVLTVNPV